MRLICFVTFLFLVSICSAQTSNSNVFALKPALGINACQVHGDSYSGYNKAGLFFGLGLNAKLNRRSSFEMGFYFSQKGAKYNGDPDNGNYTTYNLRLNYLDMPILYRYVFTRSYFFTLGPSVGYLISYKEDQNGNDVTGQDPFNKFEVGVNIGLGGSIGKNLSIELRCSNSITTIRSYGMPSTVQYPNPVAQYFNDGFYNNILTLFVSYKINKT